ncbi:MAG: hypothetical protein AB7V32_04030, partial [Candidatus Berkiella sp.]
KATTDDCLDLKRIKALKNEVDLFYREFSNFKLAVYVLTKRRGNVVMSQGAIRLLEALDSEMFHEAQGNRLEFYTSVIVCYNRYLDRLAVSVATPLTEQDILDGLIGAFLISTKMCIRKKPNILRKVLWTIYDFQIDWLCENLQLHIEGQLSGFLLKKEKFWHENAQALEHAMKALKNHNASFVQQELFRDALDLLPVKTSRLASPHLEIVALLDTHHYLEKGILEEVEAAFLKITQWQVAVLTDEQQLHQLMLLCWHYTKPPLSLKPIASNPSTNLHRNVLFAFESKLQSFGKISVPLTPLSLPVHTMDASPTDDDSLSSQNKSDSRMRYQF